MKKEYKYGDYIISKGGKQIGIMWTDIKNHLLTPSEYEKFSEWMTGQTCGALEHVSDDGKEKCLLPLVYVGDFIRFITGLPVID